MPRYLPKRLSYQQLWQQERVACYLAYIVVGNSYNMNQACSAYGLPPPMRVVDSEWPLTRPPMPVSHGLSTSGLFLVSSYVPSRAFVPARSETVACMKSEALNGQDGRAYLTCHDFTYVLVQDPCSSSPKSSKMADESDVPRP